MKKAQGRRMIRMMAIMMMMIMMTTVVLVVVVQKQFKLFKNSACDMRVK